MGYASALAWLLFVIVLGLTLLLFRAARTLVYEGGAVTPRPPVPRPLGRDRRCVARCGGSPPSRA